MAGGWDAEFERSLYAGAFWSAAVFCRFGLRQRLVLNRGPELAVEGIKKHPSDEPTGVTPNE